MTDFLLELRSEEIPARMQAKARDDLARLFTAELDKAGLAAAEIAAYSTPRRLALIARGLPLETQAVSEELKGPKVGAPPQAFEGFLRKVGLTQDQLVERGGIFFAITEKPGRKTADVLADAVPAIIRAFPWPKSQRWGAASASTESLRWVRPLSGIIALLGDDLVPFEVDGIASGFASMGHRFHHSGEIAISNAADYAAKLRAAHVILDHEERQDIIRAGAAKAAANAGLTLVADEGLVIENAGLTEWPVPMLGHFDESYLTVPPEVIQLTARVNQKYFVCKSSPERGGGSRSETEGPVSSESDPSTSSAGPPPRSGEDLLANAFICTANIDASDGGAAIVAGNEKVLAARLSDAKFFWEQDLKIPQETQAEKLSSIVFHEKLGTVADKVERVAKLARRLVEEGIIKSSPERGGGSHSETEGPVSSESDPSTSSAGPPPRSGEELADMAERAARLCKADLVTGMVGEFPELQGIMGGYYARAQGEPDAVADAVRDHYKPVGQGDDVPTAPVTVAVSLADKLDTLVGFFAIGEIPTGSKDPFALRRSALGIAALIQQNRLILPLEYVLRTTLVGLGSEFSDQVYIMGVADLAERARIIREVNEPYERLRSQHSERVSPEPPNFPNSAVFGPITVFFVDQVLRKLLNFLIDRLKVQQREAGARHDLIDAVFALGGEDDLVRLLARVKALQAFVTTDEGTNLLAGYKRAANILKSSPERGGGPPTQSVVEGALSAAPNPSVSPDGPPPPRSGEELALLAALDAAEPRATAAIAREDFEAAMAALASLRTPIDAFFDGVMVNDPDPDKRAFRMGLLTRFRDAVHKVADFSKIEG